MTQPDRGRHAAPDPPPPPPPPLPVVVPDAPPTEPTPVVHVDPEPDAPSERRDRMRLARFPALTLGAVAALIQVLAGLFLPLTPDQTSLISALTVAVLGAATAWLVKGDALVAALVGVAQALLALMLGFGVGLPAPTQAAIMALVSAVAASFVHTQVDGPVAWTQGSSPLERRAPG